MQSQEIQVGAAYTLQVGRNAVPVTVTGEIEDGGWLVETHTGRTMTVRSAERFVARVGEPAAPEAADMPATEPEAEPTADGAESGDTSAQGADTEATGQTMGLLDAAVHLLGRADRPMQCKDLVEQAREQGLWAPKRGGKTPDRTLYAAILREITTKGDAARFRKVERGRFALNG